MINDDNLSHSSVEELKAKNIKNTNDEKLVEAVLFLENKPVNINKIKEITKLNKSDIPSLIKNINERLNKVGSSLVIIKNDAGDYHLTVKKELYDILKDHYDNRKNLKLSQQAIETLAIVAYKQPITKVEIEQIRGVQVDYILKQLLEYGFIKIVGRKKVPGKPIIYGTTDKFLKYFGLLSLKDLPPIEEFDKL